MAKDEVGLSITSPSPLRESSHEAVRQDLDILLTHSEVERIVQGMAYERDTERGHELSLPAKLGLGALVLTLSGGVIIGIALERNHGSGPQPTTIISGEFICRGQTPFGPWIKYQALDGSVHDIGFAATQLDPDRPNALIFTADVPHNARSVEVDGGCGGNRNVWRTNHHIAGLLFPGPDNEWVLTCPATGVDSPDIGTPTTTINTYDDCAITTRQVTTPEP